MVTYLATFCPGTQVVTVLMGPTERRDTASVNSQNDCMKQKPELWWIINKFLLNTCYLNIVACCKEE